MPALTATKYVRRTMTKVKSTVPDCGYPQSGIPQLLKLRVTAGTYSGKWKHCFSSEQTGPSEVLFTDDIDLVDCISEIEYKCRRQQVSWRIFLRARKVHSAMFSRMTLCLGTNTSAMMSFQKQRLSLRGCSLLEGESNGNCKRYP